MRRRLATIRHGTFRELTALARRLRGRRQGLPHANEAERLPAFDPTLPTRTASYGPRAKNGGRLGRSG